MYSDNPAYAKMRLQYTIVRVGLEPFKVTGILGQRDEEFEPEVEDEDIFDPPQEKEVVVAKYTGALLCEGYYLKESRKLHQVEVDSLNLEPVSLGYVNVEDRAIFVVRKPMRQDWRQGLRRENYTFLGDMGWDELPEKELRNTILGKYPSLEEAKAITIKNNKASVAFSRNFALGGNNLYYKTRVVGTNMMLSPKFSYLQGRLESVLNASSS